MTTVRPRPYGSQSKPKPKTEAQELEILNKQIALLERQQKALESRDNLLTFSKFIMPDPEDVNNIHKSRYEDAGFHGEVAKALEAVERGEITQLIFCMPPRHGKTQMATKNFAAWFSGKHPEQDIAVASYSDTMAEDFGADTRAIMTSAPYKQVFPDHKLRRGGTSKSNIQTEKGGRLVFVGRGGALTGRGANCFSPDTVVQTPSGGKRIADIQFGELVLSYHFGRKRPVWRRVEAVSARQKSRLFRLTTSSGRMVEVTADHRVYARGAWVEADKLTAGDRLLCAVRSERDTPSRRRDQAHEAGSFFDGEADFVRSVEDTGRSSVVYDIQVEETHCFFADGILCHNCLLIDDLFKDHEEARSQTIRDQAWNWFTKVAMTRRMGKKLVVVTMTRWHSDDIIGRLTDPENPNYNEIEAKRWKIIRLPAIAEDDDPLHRKPGEPLWPQRYDLEFLLSQQRLDPLGFAALYQQRPTVADGVLFRRETIQYYKNDELPSDLRIYCASDHAVATGQRNDYTVLLKIGVDRHSNIYILECFWSKVRSDVAVEAMLEMCRGPRPPLLWWAEKGHISKSIGPFLYKRMQETQTYVNVREVTPVGDKEQRAQSISARVAMGKVFFPKDAVWTEKAINELLAFPNGTHDDFVDALAYIGLGLRSQFAAAPPKQQPSEPKFGTLAWVKRQAAWEEQKRRAETTGGF